MPCSILILTYLISEVVYQRGKTVSLFNIKLSKFRLKFLLMTCPVASDTIPTVKSGTRSTSKSPLSIKIVNTCNVLKAG